MKLAVAKPTTMFATTMKLIMWLKHFHHRISRLKRPKFTHWKPPTSPLQQPTGSCASARCASLRNQWKLLRIPANIKVWHNFQLIFSSRRHVGARRRVVSFFHSNSKRIESGRGKKIPNKKISNKEGKKYENLWENRAFDFRFGGDSVGWRRSWAFLGGDEEKWLKYCRWRKSWIVYKILHDILSWLAIISSSSSGRIPFTTHNAAPQLSGWKRTRRKKMLRFSVSCWVLINKRTIITAKTFFFGIFHCSPSDQKRRGRGGKVKVERKIKKNWYYMSHTKGGRRRSASFA